MADGMADGLPGGDVSRRGYRTGSVYQRASDGRFLATIEAGYTANGGRRRITVTGKTRQVVLRKLRDKRLELDREGHRNVQRTITVAKWAPSWLEAIQPQVTPNAYNTDRAAVRAIVEAIGAVKLGDLRPSDVRAVAAKIRKKGLSTSTALRYQGSLMRMLKAASLDGYSIPPNVLLTEMPTAAVNDREAMLINQAIDALVHIAAMPDGSRWAIPFLQGHRQEESLGLTWPEINLDAETLRISWQVQYLKYVDRSDPSKGFLIPDGYEARHLVGAAHLVRPKSDAGWRTQPLVPWAVSALRTWREIAPENEHGLVWPGRSVKGQTWPRNPASDRSQWKAIQAALGIAHSTGRPYHVHEIRHTTATLLQELGVDEGVRVAIMGHSTVASTRAYEHVDLGPKRLALAQAAERLGLR